MPSLATHRALPAAPDLPATGASSPGPLLSRPARLYPILQTSELWSDSLLDAVNVETTDRVLIVGGRTADLLCAAIRRGCRSAAASVSVPAHPDDAEVVIAPRVTLPTEAAVIAASALRAFRSCARNGRLALLLSDPSVAAIRQLTRQLRILGYSCIQMRVVEDGPLLVTCCVPSRAIRH